MAVEFRPVVPSRLTHGPGLGHGDTLRRPTTRVKGFIALTKPRIIELLLITTVPPMVVAQGGLPSGWLVLATLLGGTLAAAGANTINMVVDRDIDKLMPRTQGRPLVTGLIAPTEAMVFALICEAASFAVLTAWVNVLAAVLALSATAFYVFVYTLWLKRTSTQNIVIGGAAGCMPVLVGWAAVTNSLGWAPVVIFGIIFCWTPPHSWALAVKYADDYRAAHVPMLPAVASGQVTGRRVLGWTVVLVGVTFLLTPVAHLGFIYTVAAGVLGAGFIGMAIALLRDPSTQRAMRLFAYSISYVTLLFGAMALDVVVRLGV
jgi:protoheme IX farnesyltransferase